MDSPSIPAPVQTPPPAAAAGMAADGGFDIRLAQSGRVVRVAPGQSVIQALAAQGIEAPVSCELGLCGTCVMPVLEGIPEHHDCFLSAEEQASNTCFTPCVSRSRTALLVVDF